jgi:pimeloyl-ACP methyl ester carboxylesterase
MIEEIRVLTTGDGANISYRIARGERPRRVLVLIHGMASNLTRWSEFAEQTALRDSWDLVWLDLRGNGRSLYRGKITMETWSDDIAAILDREGYARAVLAGHCMGANLAVWFADRYPTRTAGLALIEPIFSEALAGALKKVWSVKALIPPLIALVRLLNLLGFKRRRFPSLDLRELDRETRRLMTSGEAAGALTKRYASVRYDLRFMPIAAYLRSLRELFRPLPPLEALKVPLLLLFSTGKVFSDPDIARRLCLELPDCRTVVLESHHWIPTEKPVEMRTAIEDWCRDLPSAPLDL